MVARNEHTGDKIQTKETSEAYRDNFDTIFRKAAEFNIEKEIAKQNKAYFDFEEAVCSGKISLRRVKDGKTLEECNQDCSTNNIPCGCSKEKASYKPS